MIAANTGSGPLIAVSITPYLRENQHARASYAAVIDGDGVVIRETQPQFRNDHLIALGSTGTVTIAGAIKDVHGIWSEQSTVSLSASNFSAGSTEASIGSGQIDAKAIVAPSLIFPDLGMGSGIISIHRTLVGPGFTDETRRAKQAKNRAAFHCVLKDMDSAQTAVFQQFVTALNGPHTPFYFDWTDPINGAQKRYQVRFRDGAVADKLTRGTYFSADFTLVELIDDTIVEEI